MQESGVPGAPLRKKSLVATTIPQLRTTLADKQENMIKKCVPYLEAEVVVQHHSVVWSHLRAFRRSWTIALAALALVQFSPPTRAATIYKETLPGSDITQITISGEIRAGDQETFSSDIQGLSDASVTVALEGPGGDLKTGREIGNEIRKRNFATLVDNRSECASACALIWLAGTPRIWEPGGKVGFHAASEIRDGNPTESGVANAVVGEYLTKLGLNVDAVIYIVQAPPTKITWLNEESAKQYDIRFTTVAPRSVPHPENSPVSANSPETTAETDPQTSANLGILILLAICGAIAVFLLWKFSRSNIRRKNPIMKYSAHKVNMRAQYPGPPYSQYQPQYYPKQPEHKRIEVLCPGCTGRLRIPTGRQGNVRCPRCTRIFAARS
jgi:hypothetical protein